MSQLQKRSSATGQCYATGHPASGGEVPLAIRPAPLPGFADLMMGNPEVGSGDRPQSTTAEVTLMSNWRGKYLEGGPPRGPGHYSQDGRWWWDDTQGRWYRVTDQEEVLEIQAEDMGGTSLAASLLTTLSSQYGNGYFRFVARAHSADPRWPT